MIARHWGPPAFAFGLTLFGWEVLARADTARTRIIPPPSEVVTALIRSADPLLRLHIPTTLVEAGIGLLVALILGVTLAALLDFFPLLRRAVYPLLVVSQTIPIVAIAPVLILILGFGIWPKVAVVALFGFFPIAVAMVDGLTGTDPDLTALLRAMGATRQQIWRKVRLPSALPSLFSGVRIAAAYAIGGAIIGEYVTAQYGLGQYLRTAFNQARVDQGFGAAGIAAALSVGMVAVVNLIERLSLRWYYARQTHWE